MLPSRAAQAPGGLGGYGSPSKSPATPTPDAQGDGRIDISDAVSILGYLFLGSPPGPCLDAMDTNDRGPLDITDPIYLLNFLFAGGPPPPEPHERPGTDPTEDAIDCRGY
jgi:hypothetical protein